MMRVGIFELVQNVRDEFARNGYTVIRQVFSPHTLDRHSAELSAFLLRNPAVNSPHDAKDCHPEVAARRRAFQWHSAEVLQLVMDDCVINSLRTLLLEEPYLLQVGTLSNDDGCRRNFVTRNATHHINTWIALKDVDMDSGPLWVVPGSHRLTGNHFECLLQAEPDLAARLAVMRERDATIDEWRELESDFDQASDVLLESYVEKFQLTRVPLLLKRGDIVISSEQLIHGRFKCAAENTARWCLVAQYGSLAHPRSAYFSNTDCIDS